MKRSQLEHLIRAAAIISVADDGGVTDVVAPARFRAPAWAASRPARWSFSILEYGDFGGLRLPAYSRSHWHLPDGVFPCARTRYTDVSYDPSAAETTAAPRAG